MQRTIKHLILSPVKLIGVIIAGAFFTSCNKPSKKFSEAKEKVRTHLNKRHLTEVTNLRISGVRNVNGKHYEVYYSSPDVDGREVFMQSSSLDPLAVSMDLYSHELTTMSIDQALSSEPGGIPFRIYTQISYSPEYGNNELVRENYSLAEIKAQLCNKANLASCLVVQAPDVKENQQKYLDFTLMMMERLRAQMLGIKSCHFKIIFVGSDYDLERNHVPPTEMLSSEAYRERITYWSIYYTEKTFLEYKANPESLKAKVRAHDQ